MGKSKHGEPLRFLQDHRAHGGAECLIWPFGRYTNGYGSIRFRGKQTFAHRVMCLLAHGEPSVATRDAAHSCGNGHLGCVNPAHLSWKSRADNMADKVSHGTATIGERHGCAKMTATEVKAIREAYATGDLSHSELARRFGLNPTAVGKIVRRETWRHVQ